MATRTLNVQITGDSRGINRVLDQTESRTKRWGGAMAKGFAVAGAAAAGGLAVGLTKSAKAAIEAEKSQAKMVTQLKAAGVSYKAHAQQIDEVIQKHSKLSGLDDEDLQDAFTNIVRVTGDVNKSLRLTGLAADFARAKHMDVAKAGELVGKVAGGNTGILSRYGFQVEKGASAQEALALLQSKFAGQADAYGKTTAGALDRAGVAGENLGEIVGAKLTPLLAKGATALVDLVDKAGKLGGPIREATGAVRNGYETARRAVNRFAVNNREDIDQVIRAARNLGRFFKTVFEEVIVPAVKRALPIIKGVLGGIVQVVRGLVRVVTGLINGDWKQAWDGVKDIVRGAVKAVVSVVKGAGDALLDAAKALGKLLIRGVTAGLKGLANAVKNAVVSGVKKGAEGAIRLINKINPFGDIGDGLGRKIGDGLGRVGGGNFGAGGASLMGADSDLGPFARIGASMGLHTSSGLRPGAITSSGNPSYHGTGDAIDEAGPPGAMLRYFQLMRSTFGPRLRELIYTPGGVGIKDGRLYRYTGKVAQDHYDHVHVAYTGPFGDGLGKRKGDGLGKFSATAYGPPWNAMNGTGVTRTGVNLKPAKKAYGVAVDPRVIKLGTKLKIWPNPFGYRGAFTAFDTGGAIKGRELDFYDWRGRNAQMSWGTRTVTVETVGGKNAGKTPTGAKRIGSGQIKSDPHGVLGLGRDTGTELEGLEAMGAMAALTPDTTDDVSAAGRLVGYWEAELDRAKRSKKSARITAAAQGLASARDALTGLTAPGDTGDPNQPLIDALAANTAAQEQAADAAREQAAAQQALKDEVKRQTDFAASVQSIESSVIKRSLAQALTGSFGQMVANRGLTPGSGREFAW